MKAVMSDVPAHVLRWRRTTGEERWDEMWDGVLHMSPSPNREHQDVEGDMESWLRAYWVTRSGGRVYHQINLASVGGWPDRDYRIPDLVLLTPERFHIDHNEYFEGPPAVVVEIHSPSDETYEKLPFYAELGVPEVWIIHRDTRVPEVYRLHGGDYEPLAAHEDGWLHSATGVDLRSADGNRLALRLSEDHSTLRNIPMSS